MARSPQNGRDRKTLLAVAIVVAALLLFTGWMRLRTTVVPVRAETVIRQDIESVISTNGKIEPVHNFEAHSPAPATVKRILVNEGDQVRAGQLLLQLDDADARAQSAKALAQLRAAEADMNAIKTGGTNEEVLTTRADLSKAQLEHDDALRNLQAVQRLQQNGAASPAEVQAAKNRLQKADADVQLLQSRLSGRFSNPEVARVQANLSQAKASYDAAQDLLRNLNVKAPFAGTVYALPVRPGAYVNGGELLVQVAKLEEMQVRAFVDEPEIGRLAVGQKVEIRWDATPGRTWEGVVTRVPASVMTVGTRTVGETTTKIENTDRKLLPNVNVNVSIITARHNGALTVSREAVHDASGKRFVYLIDSGKLRTQDVQVGIASLTRVEITRGVTENAQVALGAVNAAPLRSGMEVKVVER